MYAQGSAGAARPVTAATLFNRDFRAPSSLLCRAFGNRGADGHTDARLDGFATLRPGAGGALARVRRRQPAGADGEPRRVRRPAAAGSRRPAPRPPTYATPRPGPY